ncbi:glycosyltransferase family 2 protein [Klebsiella quasipneumoniae]|uniref:glycosyltransferase family 2 protein n=1 Tax=Klebsiella quasipneumoniae TaxID=1463165 RepID=UPI000C7D07AD|nr:glycosyltransferase family 2 protein [Klebsiella quasipneumoniae]PLJ35709.1 hypothetical protein B6J67_28315 [Klebsiella quasipneumoniae]PLJ64244.1 hypothetical protein B6J68_08585 [Klebsiella quasipneumoniae]HCA9137713.1 glycosyltransferase family 2 protein [Klebsiella quasipneumoniae]
MCEISIVMATYNGEKYIRQQIESILNADGYDQLVKEFIITDDGSSDGTVDILNLFKNKDPKISIINNQEHGVVNNFINGLRSVTGKYVILSDQDDLWCKDKITVLYDKISKEEKNNTDKPILFFSDSIIVDESLNEISHSFFKYYNILPDEDTEVNRLLTHNVAQGCVMIFNKKLLDFVDFSSKEYWVMHDWWFMLIARRYGVLKAINKPLIMYRVHGGNVVGTTRRTTFSIILNSFNLLKKYKNDCIKIKKQALFFIERNALGFEGKESLKFNKFSFFNNEKTNFRKIAALTLALINAF